MAAPEQTPTVGLVIAVFHGLNFWRMVERIEAAKLTRPGATKRLRRRFAGHSLERLTAEAFEHCVVDEKS